MSIMQIGRMMLGPPWQWYEAVGDPITNLGGAAIPGPRQALRHQVTIATVAADGPVDSVAARMSIRRQLRSMFNNTDLKLQGFFYVIYSDDPEQNGWYMPDFGQLADIEGAAGLATGIWKLDLVAWIKQGSQRTNREARNIWMKDLRTALYWRDTLKLVFSTDFSNLPALALTQLPPSATRAARAVDGQVFPLTAIAAGRDGGKTLQCQGLVDLDCIAFERSENNMNTGDVVIKDRRGNLTAPFYLANILQDNPISYWRLDETSGTTLNDLLGGNNATLNGGFVLNSAGALSGGSDNNASVLFNGSTGNASVPYTAELNPISMSIEAWVKPTALGAQMYAVRSQASTIGGYTLYVLANGKPTFQYANGVANIAATATNTLTAGQWAHMVGTCDGSAVRLYVNGALVAQVAIGTPVAATATPFTIGSSSVPNFLWNGSIDEVALYGYPMTQQQIANHYASGVCYDGGNQWEEAYGPDYSWSWTGSNPLIAADCPVIENGLVRIRYDSTNAAGYRVDVWDANGNTTNGSPGWVEQGKMYVFRDGDGAGNSTTWVAASVHNEGGWTPDRGTVAVKTVNAADNNSQERVYISVLRGQYGVTFEVYPAPKANGTAADARLIWTPALVAGTADVNDSTIKIDGQGSWSGGSPNNGTWTPSPPAATQGGGPSPATIIATAGTGSGLFATTTVGAANFTNSENWLSDLRCVVDYKTVYNWQVSLVTQQAANSFSQVFNNTQAYGVSANTCSVRSQNAAGYVTVDIGFTPTVAQQVLEAELMTLGTNWSSVVDATASGGNTAQTTQTADTGALSQATWPNAFSGVFRVFARVKSTNTCRLQAKTGATTGTLVTVSGSSTPVYTWVDLGEITANNTTLGLHGWLLGAGTLDIDRVEAHLVQDRTRSGFVYSGARDNGQSELYDARTLGAVVAR